MFLKRIPFIFIAFLGISVARAQKTAWSPEVSQLYIQARDYLAAGKLQQSIVIYKQAIRLAPANMLLYRDLAKAYYSAHLYEDAKITLDPLIKSKDADDQCYQVMAMCFAAEGNSKKQKRTLDDGIERFPASGILYHDLGKWYEDNNEPGKALTEWLNGIQYDPRYHMNYYEAAAIYAHTDHPVWVILYGETFVNMERETLRSYDTRKLIVEAYKKLYSTMLTKEIPQYGITVNNAHTFEDVVKDVYRKLSPEIKDGINIESLTALRTRFLISWKDTYDKQYPYTLFKYEQQLIQGEYFDLYNEWLLGTTLNETKFNNWKKDNSGALDALGNWAGSHSLQPGPHDFYGDKNTKDLFPARKQ